MAKFELKFLDFVCDTDHIKTEHIIYTDSEYFEYKNGAGCIKISTFVGGEERFVYLDKSTAIKFAKTLRTEINKITDCEVSNG